MHAIHDSNPHAKLINSLNFVLVLLHHTSGQQASVCYGDVSHVLEV